MIRPNATPDRPHVIGHSNMVEVLRGGRFYIVFGTADPDEAERIVDERVEAEVLGIELEGEACDE